MTVQERNIRDARIIKYKEEVDGLTGRTHTFLETTNWTKRQGFSLSLNQIFRIYGKYRRSKQVPDPQE